MAIYFDMDGVLADFRTGTERAGAVYAPIGTSDKKADDAMWDEIRKTPHFYATLPEIPRGIRLFKDLQAAGEKPEILTAIPKPHYRIEHSAEDKKSWAAAHLGPDVPVHICYRAEKIRKCRGPEDILIDDQNRNVEEWKSAGGTGILFRENGPIKLPAVLTLRMELARMDQQEDNGPQGMRCPEFG